MKSFLRCRPAWAICLLALGSVCATAALPLGNAERGPVRTAPTTAPAETEARVIVKYKADSALMRALSAGSGGGTAAPPQHAQELGGRLGLALTDGRTIGARAQVVRGTGLSSQQLADQLAAQSDVEYAVVDGRMHALAAPNDPLYPVNQTAATPAVGQWYLRAPTSATIVDASSTVSAINAEAAWGITTGGASVVVAVLDTGVRRDHPDLATKLLQGYDFVGGSGTAAALAVANDGDGRDGDPSDPGDSITPAEANQVGGQFYHCGETDSTGAYIGQNSSWHGTQTSGLIGAATNNGIGMASVGRNVMILPVRVLGKCGGYDSDIQAGMLWAAGLSTSPTISASDRAKVINLSLGAAKACNAGYNDIVSQLTAAGVVVVAAAGNDGLAVGSPANCPGVIGVAGVRHAGSKVGYSDLGPEIALAAPAGNCVNATGACLFPLLTTSNKGTTTPMADAAGGSIYTGGGNDASLGTSFSAPLVAGTVGLMLSANPTLAPAQVLAALKSTARAFPTTGSSPIQRTPGGPTVPVSACAAPTSLTDASTAQAYECYCTTSTCGAGMLDVGAAVAAVSTAAANIAVASTSVVAGTAVKLDGSGSQASGGAAIGPYLWTITSGSDIASFTTATNASTVTLLPSAAGTVVVGLTVTDTAGKQATSSATLTVAAAPVTTPSSSSGGGSLSLAWLIGWLAAVIGVWAVTAPRRN